MISILIPTYNQDITQLVTALHHQAIEQYVDFEIIVMEDGSKQFINSNKTIGELPFCRYILLPQNIGRSAVRNKLADEAGYNHLLFIDCDAAICSEHYVEKYLTFCKEETIVIGGTAYDPEENNPEFSLRLQYGRLREARTADKRDKNNFATFNFLISKSIFNQVRFDETIRGYGHEDMLFGHQLHQVGYRLIQIENPLIHKGLDDNQTFIEKTNEATRNLLLLYRTGRYPFLINESSLLHTYTVLKKWKMTSIISFIYRLSENKLRAKLCASRPSLLLYDLYKLVYICKVSTEK
jgi:glycosyltransferase involved in cell wall biosynthesis